MNAGKWWSHDNTGFDSHKEALKYILECSRTKHKYMLKRKLCHFEAMKSISKNHSKRSSYHEFCFEMLINRASSIHCFDHSIYTPYLNLMIQVDDLDDKHLRSIDFFNSQFMKDLYDGVAQGTYYYANSDLYPDIKEVSNYFLSIDLRVLNRYIDVKKFFKKSKIKVYREQNDLYNALISNQLDSKKLHERELEYFNKIKETK